MLAIRSMDSRSALLRCTNFRLRPPQDEPRGMCRLQLAHNGTEVGASLMGIDGIPLNVTTEPDRPRYSTTYGEQQRRRIQQATQERHRAGKVWRGTPSEDFDWPRAIAGFKRILREVYGDE